MQRPQQEEEGKSLPHFSALRSSDEGVGAGMQEEVCPGLDKAPRQPGISRAGPTSSLSLGKPAGVNKSSAICTHQSRLLAGQRQAVFHKPFFMQSCSQLCLKKDRSGRVSLNEAICPPLVMVTGRQAPASSGWAKAERGGVRP